MDKFEIFMDIHTAAALVVEAATEEEAKRIAISSIKAFLRDARENTKEITFALEETAEIEVYDIADFNDLES